MGYQTIRTSDLSGEVVPADELVSIIVRSAPGLAEPRQIDASKSELERLVTLGEVVNLEIRHNDGSIEKLSCTAAEFEKIVPRRVLADAPGLRGRRPGQRAR